MPSGTINGTTNNENIVSKIEWSYTQNIEANTSTITVALYYKRTNTGFTTSGTGSFSVNIGYDWNFGGTKYLTITENSWVKAVEETRTVAHRYDGTLSIYISGSGSIPSTTLTSTRCEAMLTLNTIPRASVIDGAQSVTLGSRCYIMWTPASSSFWYKLKFSLGSWSYTTVAFKPGITTQYHYTGYPVPMDVANQFPNSKSGTMTATLYTYSSEAATTQMGTPCSSTFTVTLPENESTKPDVGMTLAPVTPYSKFASIYLQGMSKVKASFSGSGKYGATVSSYKVQVEGKTYSSPYTSENLRGSGKVTIVGTATDSRGFTNTQTLDIDVTAYKAPYISPPLGYSNVICERCTKDGTADDAGTYLHVKGIRNYTKISAGDKVNTCSVRCRFKARGGSWSSASGEGVAVLLGSDTSKDEFDVVLSSIVLDPRYAYIVELNTTDDTYLPTAMVFDIPSEAVEFELREGGKGAAFGKHATAENLLECEWDAQFNGTSTFAGIVLGEQEITDVVIAEGASDIWYYRKWLSGKLECWGEKAISVDISTQWGSIYYGLVDATAFPFTFASAPMCQVTAEFGSTRQAAWLSVGGSATATHAPAVMICRPLIENSAGYNILYYAIGNWK